MEHDRYFLDSSSPYSSTSDISDISLSILEFPEYDELHSFGSISPISSSPRSSSPSKSFSSIDSTTPLKENTNLNISKEDLCDYIPIQEINIKIGTPIETKSLHLETIFEDVYFETPPKKSSPSTLNKENFFPKQIRLNQENFNCSNNERNNTP